MRFRLGYSWWSVPISGALGLLPPFTAADVVLDRFRLRFGPWFRIEVPLDQISSVAVVPEGPDATIPMRVSKGRRAKALHVRTGPGPAVVVRFRTPQAGFWPVQLSRAGLILDAADLFEEVSFNAADPEKFVDAVKPRRRAARATPEKSRSRTTERRGTKKVAAARGPRQKPAQRSRAKASPGKTTTRASARRRTR